jgi:hypothetical protein
VRVFAERARRRQPIAPARSGVPLRFRQGHEVSSILHPRIAGRSGPVVARFDAKGGELQEERSEALRQGRNPDEPGKKPVDALDEALREAIRNPQPRPPEPTAPGDVGQQRRTLVSVDPFDLWRLARIQQRMQVLANETEARERATVGAGGTVTHTAANMMDYWKLRFVGSVDYILYLRGAGKREPLLKKLRDAEAKLVKSAPADLVTQVEALRQTYKDKWQQEIDRAADQFVVLASNESQFLTVPQRARRVSIFGLPERLEGIVDAAANPATVARGSTPVAPSVVTFIAAVQRESGLTRVKASNYTDHEKHSPYFGNVDDVGKYSFDVHLDGLIGINAEGFYEREPLIRFLLAVERAAVATDIAWIALYNDFEVARTVNERLGERRIGFSGGGRDGSIHHGPAPYLLHLHFNIMPRSLAGQFLAGQNTLPPHIDI